MTTSRTPLETGARAGLVYAWGGFVQRGLPLLLLPLYAEALPPDQYGQIAVLVAIASVVGSLLGFGLEGAVVREAVRLANRSAERTRFINSVGLFLVVAPAGISLLVGLGLAGPVAGFGVSPNLVVIGLLAAGLQTPLTVFVTALLRAENRLRDYTIVTSTSAVLNAGVTLALVATLRLGPTGWFVGTLIASLGSLVVGLALLRHRFTRDISWPIVRAALVFGLPLLPHSLAHWGLSLSDRLILGAYTDPGTVGIYNLAYQAAAPVGLLVIAANQAVAPMYPRALDDGGLRVSLSRLATYQVHLTAWLGLAAVLIGPPIVAQVFPASYGGAAGLIPWIAVGYMLLGLYLLPMNSLSLMLGKTRWLWVPTAIAAATNVSLNLVLVPRYGAIAAAVDTAVAYGVLLVGVLAVRWVIPGPRIGFEVRRIAIGLAVMGVSGGAVLALAPDGRGVASIAARIAALAVAALPLVPAYFELRRPPANPGRPPIDPAPAAGVSRG